MNANQVAALQAQVIKAYNKVKVLLASKSSLPANLQIVSYTDAQVADLLKVLATNAKALGIPVSGTTDQARFRSLNNWLNSSWMSRAGLSGRNQDSSLDSSVLKELKSRLRVAIQNPASVASGTALDAGRTTVRAPVVPRRVTPAPVSAGAISATQRQEYQTIIRKLDVIANYGTSRQKGKAASYKQKLQALLNKTNPTANDVRKAEKRYRGYAYNGRKLANRSFAAAEKRRDAALRRAALAAPKDLTAADLAASVKPVKELVDKLDGLDSSKKPAATEILKGLIKMWTLSSRRIPAGTTSGLGPRWQMFELLKKAGDALASGNTATATAELAKANSLFTREQTLIKRYADMALSMARGLLTPAMVDKLPTKAVLTSTGRVPANQAYGREAVKKYLEDQVKILTDYMTKNAGKLSQDYISSFYQNMKHFSYATANLIKLYSYHISQNGTPAQKVLEKLSKTINAMTVPDSQFRAAWNSMSLGTRKLFKEQMRKALRLTRALTENEAVKFLLANPTWKFTAAINDTYAFIIYADQDANRKLSSLPANARKPLEAIAKLRSLVVYFGFEFNSFLNMDEDEANPAKSHDNPVYRVTVAADFLSRTLTAVRAAGLPATVVKPLLDAGTAWNAKIPAIRQMITAMKAKETAYNRADKKVADAKAAKKPATEIARLEKERAKLKSEKEAQRQEVIRSADAIFNLAFGILHITEGELRTRNASIRPTSMGANSAALRRARSVLDEARAEFLRTYKVPAAGALPFTSLPAYMAGTAIWMLSPPALPMAELYGRYFVLTEAPENATVDAKINSYAKSIGYNLRFTQILRNDASAGVPFHTQVLKQASGRYDLMMLLDPRVSRFATGLTPLMNELVTPTVPDKAFGRDSKNYDFVREDRAEGQAGQVFQLLNRQGNLIKDVTLPLLIRGMNQAPRVFGEKQKALIIKLIDKSSASAPLKASMKALVNTQYTDLRTRIKTLITSADYRGLGINDRDPLLKQVRAKMYSIARDQTKPYSQQKLQLNKLLLLVLDVRIAELENRLDKGIRTTDGTLIKDLERSKDPRVHLIKRAREALTAAKTYRAAFARDVNKNIFQSRLEPKSVIVMVENATASLRDKGDTGGLGGAISPGFGSTIEDIPKPPVVTPKYKLTWTKPVSNRFRRVVSLGGSSVRLTLNKVSTTVTIKDQRNRKVPVSTYQRQNGKLTYYWFIFQTSAWTDKSGNNYEYLVRPDYVTQPEFIQRQEMLPAGVVVRNVTLSDGTKGDFVVKVRKTGYSPSKGPKWEPIMRPDGKVDKANVLCKVGAGTLEPVSDSMLDANMDKVAFEGVGRNTINVFEPKPTTPVVIVRQPTKR